MIDNRIAERRREVRQERQRRRRRRTFVVALVLIVIAGLVVIERSQLVALDEVRVTGTDRLSEDEVLDAAALELGTSTLRLRLGAVAERVTRLPLVAEAHVRRADPLTVEIEVEERVPALMAVGDGTAVLIDREGIVLIEETLETVPEIVLRDPPPQPGAQVDEDAALANAFRVWRGLSGPLRAETTRYVADSGTELTLELAQGVEVRFGRAERIDEKVRALGRILEDVGDTPIEAIDVRAPRAPVVIAP
jgi:cell division protein FtsQ